MSRGGVDKNLFLCYNHNSSFENNRFLVVQFEPYKWRKFLCVTLSGNPEHCPATVICVAAQCNVYPRVLILPGLNIALLLQ